MYRLWLEDKLVMAEVDGPVFPPTGRSIDDVMEMFEVLDEWHDADRRAQLRQDAED